MAAKKTRTRSMTRRKATHAATRASARKAASRKPVAKKAKALRRKKTGMGTKRRNPPKSAASSRRKTRPASSASAAPARSRQDTSLEPVGLRQLLVQELREIHDAENQLLRLIPRLARAADSDALRHLFEERRAEGEHIVIDVEEALERLGATPGRQKNIAAEGLVSDLREHVQDIEQGPALDTVMIAGLQKAEHYCIASWGTAKSLAAAAGQGQFVGAMERALEEGHLYDERLTELAMDEITPALGGRRVAQEQGAGHESTMEGDGADAGEEGHGQEFPFSATFERSPMRRKAVSTVPFQSIEEDAENKQEQLEKRGRGTVRRGRDN